MSSQHLRLSQYVTTYGPGAILEGANGPRVIPALDRSGLFPDYSPTQFEITDLRLSQGLLNGAGIVRIPSNAELGETSSAWVYRTDRFPSWSYCVSHHILYRKSADSVYACPQCVPLAHPGTAWNVAQRQAIRFIMACPAGHMDDVNWPGIIAHTRPHPPPDFLRWRANGGALRQIDIQCPDCSGSINLGLAYGRPWPCSGRYPETGHERPGGCHHTAKMIQRGAANVRLPELRTAVTIPPRATPLHRILEQQSVQGVLVTSRPTNKAQLVQLFEQLRERNLVQPAALTEVQNADERQLMLAVEDVLRGEAPANDAELKRQELRALSLAATDGYPPVVQQSTGIPALEVDENQVRLVRVSDELSLRVCPVSRLRVVMVQVGYRRLEPSNFLVDRSIRAIERTWYPGAELFGEGIFIEIADPGQRDNLRAQLVNTSAGTSWNHAYANPSSYGFQFDPLFAYQVHPCFVWWHGLAHRLINAIAIDSGYNSANIRERVYLEDNGSEALGGVLLYTAQPGGDGTLGGLVSLVPHFEDIIARASLDLDSCSNDPLCQDERFAEGRANGSACYACLFLSETSCEHRNMFLDRALLRVTM